MRRIAVFLFLAFLVCACMAEAAHDPAAKAREVVELLAKGDYGAAAGLFGPALREEASADAVQRAWEDALARYGAFQNAGPPAVRKEGITAVAYVPVTFAKGLFDLRVSFDGDGLITDMIFTEHN